MNVNDSQEALIEKLQKVLNLMSCRKIVTEIIDGELLLTDYHNGKKYSISFDDKGKFCMGEFVKKTIF